MFSTALLVDTQHGARIHVHTHTHTHTHTHQFHRSISHGIVLYAVQGQELGALRYGLMTQVVDIAMAQG